MKAAEIKPRFANQRNSALALTEVLIVVAALLLLVAILLPVLAVSKRKSSRLGCVNVLRQIGISYRMWGDDHGDQFPMQVSVTNDGAMELALTGNVAACFATLSNILDNPAILVCPQDTSHLPATNFANLSNSNVSYFVGLDAAETQPQTLLSGDDNLIVNDNRVQSGILNLRRSDALAWAKDRHKRGGNILMADGSARRTTSQELTSAARLATNRLAIP